MEARIGDLVTTYFQPALMNNELHHQRVLEPAVESAVNRQLHVAISVLGRYQHIDYRLRRLVPYGQWC